MTTNQFDPHAIIKKLAEAEWKCPEYYEMKPGDRGSCNEHCKAGCGGTGRKVPFASLRVECRSSARPLLVIGDTDDTDRGAEIAHQEKFHREICSCKGLHWIPEPDEEKACHRLRKWAFTLPYLEQLAVEINITEVIDKQVSYEEAVSRAAEAWLDEKMKEETP